MNVYIKGGLAALLVACGLFAWYRSKEDSLPVNQSPAGFQLIKQMENDGVPDVALSRLDGTSLKLSDLRGKIVIVNFWASWCNPCVEEFPSLVKLVTQFKNDVVVLAVSEDETREDMTAFMKAMKLPAPGIEIVWDEKKESMKTYGVEKIPETFLVDRNGKLIRKVLGIENWANEDAIQYFKMLTSTTTASPTPPDALAPVPSNPNDVVVAKEPSAEKAADNAKSAEASKTAESLPEKKKSKPSKKSKKKSKSKKH